MRHFFQISFLAFFLFSIGFVSAQNAEHYLKERGEVYFSFNLRADIDFVEQIETISKIISIDDVKDGEVHAYANAKEFKQFELLEYTAKILTPPSLLLSKEELVSNRAIANWDYYPTYQEYLGIMQQFAIDYPELCEVVDIGSTEEGRDLLFIHINDNLGIEQEEPEFMYTSSMHGDEITGYVLMLRLIEYLLENYGVDAQATNLVNSIDIWINPLANPDGTYAGGENTVSGATRYNANFVNLNRNYPDPEDGPHPDGNAYQAETIAFMDFAEDHHFTMSMNFHGGAEVVNYPWDTWSRLAADDNWWVYVSRQYADVVHENSPAGYFGGFDNGITNGYDWYTIAGGRQDYMNYENNCREVTLEISDIKLPPPSELPEFWEYNYRSLLNYMEQSLYGIRGLITDEQTGLAVAAEVFIVDHDEDNSQVYSSLPVGDYNRLIYEGVYSVTYSAEGYISKVVNDINVVNDNATFVNVQLTPIVEGLNEEELLAEKILIYPNPTKDQVNILLPKQAKSIIISNLSGQTIFRTSPDKLRIQIDVDSFPKGIYLLSFKFENATVFKKVVIQ
ncbi:MAG: zinc carboxypeptidase [Bacteroidetes bacterium]|nr:MAG: zinc carboxypeptidase [Bacteroidota bacterium]